MQASMEGRPLDRAAMIEAASRSLRQQMGPRSRDRPRSKGSFYDGQASLGAAAGAAPDARTSSEFEPRSTENAQRRVHSAENQHRTIRATQPVNGGPADAVPAAALSQPASALDYYPVEEVPPQSLGFERPQSGAGVSELGDVRRPTTRKKHPSASASAGLGAFASPVKITDAFEQMKTRQPIPVESWGPRPPSRGGPQLTEHKRPAGLDPAALEQERGTPIQHPSSTTSRSRSDTNMASNVSGGGTWAAARYAPMHDPRRGRDSKAKRRGTPEDFGVFGHSSPLMGTNPPGRSQSSAQLTKSSSGAGLGAFDYSTLEGEGRARPSSRPGSSVMGSFGQGGGLGSNAWASHVDVGPTLEVSGRGLSESSAARPSTPAGQARPITPAGLGGMSSPKRRGSFQQEPTASLFEDAEADIDLSARASAYRRDSRDGTDPQLIITRSSQQKKERGDARRGRDDRNKERDRKNMPFSTGLDPDFLSLFAS